MVVSCLLKQPTDVDDTSQGKIKGRFTRSYPPLLHVRALAEKEKARAGYLSGITSHPPITSPYRALKSTF